MYKTAAEGGILFIRHGNTDYNTLYAIEANKKILKFQEIWIDTPLSQLGKSQSEKLAENLVDINIKYVFVSPMLRTIQTCMIALEKHKNRDKMELYVHPLISETLSGTCDFSIKR